MRLGTPPALLMVLSALLHGQDGARIFRQSCAVGYCHGTGGASGRAPALVDRGLDAAHVMKVTRDGIPGTGMPGWKDRLNPAELNAVVAYVVKLSGGTGTAVSSAGDAMPAPARRGRDLFLDAVRGVRCSTCHLLEGMGAAVGPNLAAGDVPDLSMMRNGRPSSVRQAALGDGDAFPALLVEQNQEWWKVYDLTVPPPVLRTIPRAELSWSGPGAWNHAEATRNYTDAELRAVAEYLRWVSSR